MQVPLVILSATLALVQPPPQQGAPANLPPGQVVVANCTVAVAEDPIISAEVEGVLTEMPAKVGHLVNKGDVLARVDPIQAKLNLDAANAKLTVAKRTAESRVDEEYAERALRVSIAVYKASEAANEQQPGAVPQMEMEKKRLLWDQSFFGKKKAEMDHGIALLEVIVAEAQVNASTEAVSRHDIKSPVDDATVVDVFRNMGEWVKAGDPVMRIVQMDPLHIEGFVDLSQARQSEIAADQPVEVHVEGLSGPIQGKIIFVNPETQPKYSAVDPLGGQGIQGGGGGEYQIRAEVRNKKMGNGTWLLYPGVSATIVFQKKNP